MAKPVKLTHLVGMTVAGIALLLVNLRYQILPNVFFAFIALLFIAVLAARWYLTTEPGTGLSGLGTSRTGSNSITPSDAATHIQDYLEEHPFYRPIDYSTDNRDKIHEDTDIVYVNGEEKLFYGIIGKEVDYEGRYRSNTIRVIWNCTDDCFWTYDAYVPGKHRTNPLFGKDRWSKTEGYRGQHRSQKRNQGGTQVFIQQGDATERDDDDSR